ncbi:hypothetical protein CHLRE_12g488000v5 [Chlamydomonas reinhardtii]|uniref:Uncharacterized protein n=1 Tax=Chlamydomonas reinhardtii TaxID=3055 RepID=A0A2K3D2A1_CHLRE|nr:uncharacterized protein CHLRE_12g488000v5 [Chlamydomonas reinhardtii]PNW74664.1 hypothetical protein CHLRE_12g488000v5 [Chlamydomonas reinhardtii]
MTAGSQSVAKARPAIKQDRPSFHIAPPKGWLNDPNGPLFYAGYYHMFYQHIPESCIWSFGLVWGHAVSRDLVTWEHLPPAIVPTPGGLDADGCFSGCATLDEHGVPTILYTGVRLRSNGAAGPLPPVETDLQLPFIESQCAARPVDPSDPKLTHWTKIEYPWMALPPAHWGLGGWRDPYIISRPGADGSGCWSLIIGSGVKDNGGTVLVYKSKELLDGWQLHGELCHGRGEGSTTGFIWECPLLTKLPALPAHIARGGVVSHGNASRASTSESGDDMADTPHFFCISPDACTNPSYYWLGRYDTESMTFNLKGADGPFRLDLGDILYAPNTLEDTANGRTLLWGWNQEKRTKVGAYDYAGCLSVPRILWAEPSTVAAEPSSSSSNQSSAEPSRWALHQQPVPELSRLRKTDAASCWRLSDDLPGESAELIILGSARLPLPVVSGPFLDIELVLERADSGCTASGLLLTSTTAEGGAALLYHWDSGVLEVVFEALDPHTLTFSLAAPGARRVGGPLLRPPAPGQPLSLRVFLDYSCLEVFTGDGEVLTARVYRGVPSSMDAAGGLAGIGAPSAAGIDIISVKDGNSDGNAGATRILHCEAYEMSPAFRLFLGAIDDEEEALAAEPIQLPAFGAPVAVTVEAL